MLSPEDITVGVELEMILHHVVEDSEYDDGCKLVVAALEPLARTLRVDIVNTASDLEERRNMRQLENLAWLNESFHVQGDETIVYDEDSEQCAEVATPILGYRNWATVITKMCNALKKSQNFKLRFNDTTGLHVHVGIKGGYNLQQLKRISKAVILFEPLMDLRHPNRLSARSKNEDYFQSNRYNRVFKDLTDLQCMRVIDEATTTEQLLERINCNPVAGHRQSYIRDYRYNFTSSYGTIEFRQAIATDDEDQILDWVGRAIDFVTAAIDLSTDRMFEEWARGGAGPNVLRRYGVPTSR